MHTHVGCDFNVERCSFLAADRPTIDDVVVIRDPAKMLRAVDSRTLVVNKGDKPI